MAKIRTHKAIVTDEKTKPVDAGSFTNRPVKERKFNSGLIKFAKLYDIYGYKKYFFAAIVGLVMSFVTALLVEQTGLYVGGTSAFCQGIARFVLVVIVKHEHPNIDGEVTISTNAHMVYLVLFWGLYLAFNVPMTIFAYKKISKKFALLSLTYIVSCQVCGFCWSSIFEAAGFTPTFLGNTATVDSILNSYGVKDVLFSPKLFPQYLAESGDGRLDWTIIQTAGNLDPNQKDFVISTVTNANETRSLLLFLYAGVYAFFSSVFYALMYIIGGSTAGSDYVTVYFSQEKNKNLGGMFIIINGTFMLAGILIGSFGAACYVRPEYASLSTFISGNLLSSLLWVILHGLLLNKLFPWSKICRIHIYSNKSDEIAKYLRSINFTQHTFISDAKRSSGETQKFLQTTCQCIEVPKLISVVRKFDKDCIFTSQIINDIDGKINFQEHAK